MAKLPGQNIQSKEKVEQKLNFEKHFGVNLSGEPRLRDQIGAAILERIETRTVDDNQDVNGKSFDKYSTEYKESEEFSLFGKSASDINLQLTGRMMESVDSKNDGNSVTTFIEEGQTGKAYGHISGFKGHPTIKNGPKRDFFGVTSKDIAEIKSEFRDDLERVKTRKGTEREDIRDSLFTTATTISERQTTEELFSNIFGEMFNEES